MREVIRLLSSVRMLSLTGPPGCGKTRLAVETGHTLQGQIPDGVWLVDLTQAGDAETITELAAQSLGITILGDTDLEKVILDFLRDKHLLIIFDNCEHVVEHAARLCLAVLSSCPQVRILATSQVQLGIPGEQEWLTPSLPLPERDEPLPGLEELRQFGAVRLFEERATATLANFQLTVENAHIVVDICQRLDGIPLAIELAAARVKLISVDEIAARLDSRFELLAAPRRLVSTRHKTLQAAIDWSFKLLNPEEQALLCRLSVFTGTFTLEAVEKVCGFDPIIPDNAIGLLAELVDRSLVVVSVKEGQETHYRLLESIHLYGGGLLTEEERTELKDRHLSYYVYLAHTFDHEQGGPLQIKWTDRLEADLPNIRAAVNWVLSKPDPSRVLQGLNMVADLSWFYRYRDHFKEPVSWLEGMLALAEESNDPSWLAARASAHYGLGWLYFFQGYPNATVQDHFETSRVLWKQLGPHGRSGYAYATLWKITRPTVDPPELSDLFQECRDIIEADGDSVGKLSILLKEGELAERMNNVALAEASFRKLLDVANQVENFFFIGLANISLNAVLQSMNRNEEALNYAYQALDINTRIGSQRLIVMDMVGIIETLIPLGRLEQAENWINQSLKILDRFDIEFSKPDIQYCQGEIHLLKGDFTMAKEFFRLSTRAHFKRNYWTGFLWGSLGFAAALAAEEPLRAARIIGFAQKTAGTSEISIVHENVNVVAWDRIRTARYLLGDAAFTEAVAAGAACTLDELIPPEDVELLIPAVPLPSVTPRKAEKARFSGLTKREREIAALIAQGLSNPAISRELIISERTVTTHVTNILSKLGFSSRTQIAAWAAEKGLTQP